MSEAESPPTSVGQSSPGADGSPNSLDAARLLARGSIAVLGVRVGALALRLGLSLALVHSLGAAAYGAFSYSLAWLAILLVPGMCGLDQAVSRFMPGYRGQAQFAFLRGMLAWVGRTGLAASLITAAGFAALVLVLPSPRGSDSVTMALTALVLPFAVSSQLRQAVLRAFDRAALAQVPENWVYPVALTLAVLIARSILGRDVPSQLAASLNVLAWMTSFSVGAIMVRRMVVRRLPVEVPAEERVAWTQTLLPLTLSAGAYQLFSRADVAILGWFAEASDVGVYNVALRASELMFFVYEATMLAGTAIFSRIYVSGDMAALQSFTTTVTRAVLYVSLPALPAFYFGAPWLLGLFGSEFVAGVTLARIMLVAFFISSLGGFVLQMLYITGHERSAAAAMGAAAALNIVLSLVLIPRFGTVGAAISAGISVVAMKASLVYLLYSRAGILALPIKVRRPLRSAT